MKTQRNVGIIARIVDGSFFESKFFSVLIFVFLSVLYLALAYKDPFKTNNLISNLEPFPDTFYYSVPVWNWLHGDGYKMAYEGLEISKDVPPLYGVYLAPFFKLFDDVRAYYYGNVLLNLFAIFLFFRLVKEIFKHSKVKNLIAFLCGFVFVTNFYFYNLPTLMMAENIQLPLIFGTILIILKPLSLRNLVGTVLLSILLIASKMSNLPVVACLILWTFVKVVKTKFWLKYSRRTVTLSLVALLGLVFVFFLKYLYPYLGLFSKGDWWFSTEYFKEFFPVFLSQFIGKNGHYLWYFNQQIESIVGYVALFGVLLGLVLRRYREKTLTLSSVILAVVVFHSFMYFPEGRYISAVIPLYIIFVGMLFELLSRLRFGYLSILLFCFIYLGFRVNVNGFEERKITSIKRQILNNQLEENEVPWNYLAIQNFNSYFKDKSENVYLGTLLPPFNFFYFGNGNYKYLPISNLQEFADSRAITSRIYREYGGVLEYYEYLLENDNDVYVTNYFLANNPDVWPLEFKKLEDNFVFTQVADGCMDLCKIYKLGLKEKL